MADVELVIKMPEDVFKRTVFYREFRSVRDCILTIKALEKAIPLPKGHGRLIEVTPQLEQRLFEYERYTGIDECPYEDAVREIDYAPTIIEADKE